MKRLANAQVPVIGFAACSGTGKTTLLERIIPLLKGAGLNVGLIKHSHHSFEIDQPEKDSFRLRRSGANPVMLTSSKRRAVMTEINEPREPELDEELKYFDQSGLDLILVEGFKKEEFPKIELNRRKLGHPLMFPSDHSIIALATDIPLLHEPPIPWLDLNEPTMIADFIRLDFMRNATF